MNNITLLIATYNWPEALKLCLESVRNQTMMPLEIVIADDGSDDRTRRVIEQYAGLISSPIVHVWHEDDGFRKTLILNKAIARAKGEYIVQIDGDTVLERHFIEDHAELMEKNYFVCGSRSKLKKEETQDIIAQGLFNPSRQNIKLSFILNSLRIGFLRRFMALRYAKKIDHMRGSNMAYWRNDAIKVNGYDEDLLQWGHEDGEFVIRLHNAGVKKKSLKMGGIQYHLWHNESSRSNEQRHLDAVSQTTTQCKTWCQNGIDKYL